MGKNKKFGFVPPDFDPSAIPMPETDDIDPHVDGEDLSPLESEEGRRASLPPGGDPGLPPGSPNQVYSNEPSSPSAYVKLPPMIVGVPWAITTDPLEDVQIFTGGPGASGDDPMTITDGGAGLPAGIGPIGSSPYHGVIQFIGTPSPGPPSQQGATWHLAVHGVIGGGGHDRRFPISGEYTVQSPVVVAPATPTITIDPRGGNLLHLIATVNAHVQNNTTFSWVSVSDPGNGPGTFLNETGTYPTFEVDWTPNNKPGVYNFNGVQNFSGGGAGWFTVGATVVTIPTLAADPVNGWDLLIGVTGSPATCNPNETIPFEVMAGGVDDTFFVALDKIVLVAFSGTESTPVGTISNVRYATPLGDLRNILFDWNAPSNFSGAVTVRVKFALDVTRIADYAITVNTPVTYTAATTPPLTGTSLPGCTSGAAYTTPVTASGGNGTYNWSVISGTLPPGLSLSAASGTTINIAGTPDAGGTQLFTFVLQCVDTSTGAFGGTNARQRTLSIQRNGSGGGALTVTPSETNPIYLDGQYPQLTDLDVALRYVVSGAGMTSPFVWSITGLPTRLTVDPGDVDTILNILKYIKTSGAGSTGVAVQTDYALSIGVSDSSVPVKAGSYSHTLKVNPPTPDSLGSVLAASLTNNVGDSVVQSIICARQASSLAVRGFTADDPGARFNYALGGTLPPGLTFVNESSGTTARITGSPTTATGSPFNFTITVTDTWRTNDTPRVTNHAWAISGAAITVALTPDPPASQVVGTSQAFSAAVTGSPTIDVNWYVDGIQNGNDVVGRISATGGHTCNYIAPANATVAKRVIRAVAVINPTVFDEVSVQIVPRATITPSTQSHLNSQSKDYSLVVDGNGYGQTPNVTVIVNGIAGGNPTVGTASISGNTITYTAPASGTGSFPFYAVLNWGAPAFPTTPVSTSSNTAIANVGAQSVLVTPNSTTVICGAVPAFTQQFTAVLSGGGSPAYDWFVNDVAGGNSTFGTISSSGLFTAPTSVPVPAVITIKASVQGSPGTFGTSSITLVPFSGSLPAVTAINPTSGSSSGGTNVTLTGTGFTPQTTFSFAYQTTIRGLLNIVVLSATQATATTPQFPFANVAVDINPYQNGTLNSAGIKTEGYTYGASTNPAISGFNPPNTAAGSGITSLAILGSNFQTGCTVTYNGQTRAVTTTTPNSVAITLQPSDTATAGNYSVIVTNPGGAASSPAFFAVQGNCPSITTTVLTTPAASIGIPYNSGAINAAGGTSPYSWSISEGTLPNGLSLQVSTGLTTSIQGTPSSTAQTSTFKVRITDATGSTCYGERQFTITMGGGALSIQTTSPLPDARLSSSYNQGLDFSATGGTTPYTWSQTGGSLPDGLTFNPAIPRIVGTPTNSAQIGTAFTIQITVRDAVNTTFQRSFVVTLREALSNPQVTLISPDQGVVTGGTAVTITGANYLASPPPTVLFGTAPASNVVVTGSGTQINCTTPSGAAGPVNVVITNNDTGTITVTNGFTYVTSVQPVPSSIDKPDGPFQGGKDITISGSNLDTVTTVTINGNPATNIQVVTDPGTNQKVVKCRTPAWGPAPYPTTKQDVNVVLTNTANQSGTLTGGYTFRPPPHITAVIPSQTSSSGGSTIFITGTGFFQRGGVKPVIQIGNVIIPPSSITLIEE